MQEMNNDWRPEVAGFLKASGHEIGGDEDKQQRYRIIAHVGESEDGAGNKEGDPEAVALAQLGEQITPEDDFFQNRGDKGRADEGEEYFRRQYQLAAFGQAALKIHAQPGEYQKEDRDRQHVEAEIFEGR